MKRISILVLLAAACSSDSTNTPASDAPPGTADAHTGDAPPGAADAPATGGPDGGGGRACTMTLEAYCADASCIRRFEDLPTCGSRESIRDCGALRSFTVSGVDTAQISYYTSAGDLVAVISSGLGPSVCVAGPSTFTIPTTCGEPILLLPCPDGGK